MSLVNTAQPVDGVGVIELHDPPRNFGSYALLADLAEALSTLRSAGCRAVVLTSDVPGYFMAHAYLPDVLDAYERPKDLVHDPLLWRRVTHELERGPMVSIAVNHGQAWGGGAEISWACNMRVATADSTYAQIEVALGVIPGGGGTVRLARLAGQSTAMRMLLSGEPLTGQELHRLGVVQWLSDTPEQAVAQALRIAGRIAKMPPRAVAACKRGILQTWDLGAEDALRLEGYIFNSTMRPDTLARIRRVQDRYDEGEDSWAAFEIPLPGAADPVIQ
jgi:enoyl-CoA hydratase/carnithine racemase